MLSQQKSDCTGLNIRRGNVRSIFPVFMSGTTEIFTEVVFRAVSWVKDLGLIFDRYKNGNSYTQPVLRKK